MIIGITGGIGAGKSIVSKILRTKGYPVYDCDSEAKRIMDASDSIKERLNTLIHPEIVVNGIINRKLLAEIVFNDVTMLNTLNSIVHKAVAEDIRAISSSGIYPTLFVETAILYQSNLDMLVDGVWEVTAPVEIKIQRVINRNSCSRDDVLARIKSQEQQECNRRHKSTFYIINDDVHAVLPQVQELLSGIKS